MKTQISDTRRRFATINECIYCGAKDRRLADEHIIPYSLAGDAIIFEKASCKPCADQFTRDFESDVIKHSFELFRFKIGAPSRSVEKKRRMPKTSYPVFMGSIAPGSPMQITAAPQADRDEHPGGYIVLRLCLPKILTGEVAKADDRIDAFSNIDVGRLKEWMAKTGNRTSHIGQINGLNFARFLAKIAHAFAIAEKGNDAFEPLTLQLITGKTEIFTDIVGGEHDIPPPDKNLHELQNFVWDRGDMMIHLVRIRLFGFAGAPIYHVAVGKSPSKRT